MDATFTGLQRFFPCSGYIPSSVYTRSQYRSQQYPTLSTRSHSVPADEGRVPHPRVPSVNGPTYTGVDPALTETPGGLYNIPQQRTSLACHSVDDLDTSTLITHPHPHPNHHQPYRQRNDSQDRCGWYTPPFLHSMTSSVVCFHVTLSHSSPSMLL